jgi:hypothetical protein
MNNAQKNASLPPPPTARLLPPKFKHVIEIAFRRRLRWKERLQILFGYNLLVEVKVLTEHSTGKFEPITQVQTTEFLDPPPAHQPP